MHNIPSVLGGSDAERQRHADVVAAGVVELNRAMDSDPRSVQSITH